MLNVIVEEEVVVPSSPSSWDLKWFLKLLFSALFVAVGFHTLLKNTASKYFEVHHAAFEGERNNNNKNLNQESMPGVLAADENPFCAVCGSNGTKKCSRCKAVRYCSQQCQQSHWKSGHKANCKDFHDTSAINRATNSVLKPSSAGGKSPPSIALIPCSGTSRPVKQQPKDVLFPYDEFVKLFNWDKPGFPPCGLLNCGNSCFANVVLQCLSFTRPLVAYLLEKGHRRECGSNDWCFLCEFENHIERIKQSSQAFSPTSILSRLSNIGGTLGYGRQEDAHEFMRFSIDAMQSACLDEFGGEKAVPPKLQETTLIQHIFSGRLQSEVICTKCEKNSNQYESMMDLTVEINGVATSLEECLDQFTAKEWLHGENMYKCDGCKDYVKAWKRLTVKHAPNILTIALKRFQSGRFGKLNKRVAFPETLNLSPYMSEGGDGYDIYKLYAVVVHIDMLNASFFGHYICYIKDFRGNWFMIDDWKVTSVDLEQVLSQGAYMLLYSRSSAAASGLQIQTTESEQTVKVESERGPAEQIKSQAMTCHEDHEVFPSDVSESEHESSTGTNSIAKREHSEDVDIIDITPTGDKNEISSAAVEESDIRISQTIEDLSDVAMDRSQTVEVSSDVAMDRSQTVEVSSDVAMDRSLEIMSSRSEEKEDTDDIMARSCPSNEFSVSTHLQNGEEDSEYKDAVKCKLVTEKDDVYLSNGHASAANKSDITVEGAGKLLSIGSSFPIETNQGNGN